MCLLCIRARQHLSCATHVHALYCDRVINHLVRALLTTGLCEPWYTSDLITQRLAAQQKATEEVDTVIAQQRSEEQRRRMVIQLYIHSAMVGDRPVGPLRLVADATIGDVEDKVMVMMMWWSTDWEIALMKCSIMIK